MPSPKPIPKHLRRIMLSFRARPVIVQAFRKHVKKSTRSQWLENAMLEKLEKEGVEVELPPLPTIEEDLVDHG